MAKKSLSITTCSTRSSSYLFQTHPLSLAFQNFPSMASQTRLLLLLRLHSNLHLRYCSEHDWWSLHHLQTPLQTPTSVRRDDIDVIVDNSTCNNGTVSILAHVADTHRSQTNTPANHFTKNKKRRAFTANLTWSRGAADFRVPIFLHTSQISFYRRSAPEGETYIIYKILQYLVATVN